MFDPNIKHEPDEIYKVFVSLPMNERSNWEIINDMNLAVHALEFEYDCQFEMINSFDPAKNTGENQDRIEALGYSISKMKDADLVYFCPGYDKSCGCTVENTTAYVYGIPRIFHSQLKLDVQKYIKEQILNSITLKFGDEESNVIYGELPDGYRLLYDEKGYVGRYDPTLEEEI